MGTILGCVISFGLMSAPIQAPSDGEVIAASSAQPALVCLRGVFVDRLEMPAAARPDFSGQPKGPDDLPERLEGIWKVSLCVHSAHSWIRFEDVQTGQVHTLSRVMKGYGGKKNPQTGQWLIPPTAKGGVHWDYDLYLEDGIRAGRHLLVSVILRDPPVYRGGDQGQGYRKWDKNCAGYARDAWRFYSGEEYRFLTVHIPDDLAYAVWKRHPELPFARRMGLER